MESLNVEQMNDDEKNKPDWSFSMFALITTVIILGLWIGTYYLLRNWPNEDKSSFGDMFGSINALFSGLALAGIILTILLQRKELGLQRQELKETRIELKRTATAQENSEKALNRQAENLKISAKLAALNTLVSFYSDLELNVRKGVPSPSIDLAEIVRRKNAYVQRIEEILETKEAMI